MNSADITLHRVANIILNEANAKNFVRRTIF